MEKKDIILQVAESYKIDVGRGIVRVGSDVMAELGLRSGDVVKIIGKEEIPAIVMRLRGNDEGLGIIRMDGVTRMNAGVKLGDDVKIEKVEDVKEARTIELSPTEQIMLSGDVEEFFKERLIDKPVVDGMKIMIDVLGRRLYYIVTSLKPKGIAIVTENTNVTVSDSVVESKKKTPNVRYEDIGGLKNAIYKIREMVELPLKHPELFERLGIEPPKGVLLHGPPGCGKTLLAKAVANESGANFLIINGPEIISKWYGQSEQNLRKIFEDAEKNAPSIIFIDEIDAIAPKREEVKGDVEKRVVSQLLTLMDGLKGRGKVIVIAATNIPNALDPALRRPGRFDREIEIGVPDKDGRKEILQIHTRGMPLTKDVDLDKIAEITYGYVGADLAALCKEAAMHAMKRVIPQLSEIKKDKPLPKDILEKLKVTQQDFIYALKIVEPSAMREIMIEIPRVKWSDIGGLEKVKKTLKEMVEWPLKYPDSFKKLGIKPPRGILLYGPPGCGKTLLAKAVANESGANFISIKGPEILSKWVGESEKQIRSIFRRAKQVAPAIVFFDELDSIAPRRGSTTDQVTERIVSQILSEMSGIEDIQDVVVMAATNRPDIVDPALLRPGRFEKQILVPIPDKDARLKILKVQTKGMPLKDVDLESIAERIEGFSGADIEALCREAALNALRKSKKADKVTMKDFEEALKTVTPSLSSDMNKFYENVLNRIKKSNVMNAEKLGYTG